MRYIGPTPGVGSLITGNPVVWYNNLLAAPGRFNITGIPQGFSTLHGKAMLRSNPAVNGDIVYIFPNNDETLANYVQAEHIFGATEANSLGSDSNIINIPGGINSASFWAILEFWIERYTSADHNKAIRAMGAESRNTGTTAHWGWQTSIYWKSTAAITSLAVQLDGFTASGDGFTAGSWLQLLLYR